VLGLEVVEPVRKREAARAGHVPDDDRWHARQMPSQIACEQSCVGVIAAARSSGRQNRDGLAVEGFGRMGRWANADAQKYEAKPRENQACLVHRRTVTPRRTPAPAKTRARADQALSLLR